MLVRCESKSRRDGGRKPWRASSTVSKKARLTRLKLGGRRYEVAGQRLAHVLPASAVHRSPPPTGEASIRSRPSDEIEVAPLASGESLPTSVHVLPPSRVTYTPPVTAFVLGEAVSSDT